MNDAFSRDDEVDSIHAGKMLEKLESLERKRGKSPEKNSSSFPPLKQKKLSFPFRKLYPYCCSQEIANGSLKPSKSSSREGLFEMLEVDLSLS